MRKALVTMTIGERYEREYQHLLPLRTAWASRHGWEMHAISSIPSEFRKRYQRRGRTELGWCCLLYKLAIPEVFRDFDLVAFVDSDIAINPNAPCLSEHAQDVPVGGFAAVQPVRFDERARLFPRWNRYYYDDLRRHGHSGVVRHPEDHVNSGVMLFRPREVMSGWRSLLALDSGMNEENRLSVHEVQNGRCFFLSPLWNVVWMYERYRIGMERPVATLTDRVRAKVKSQWSLPWIDERTAVLTALKGSHMLHFAREHNKIFLIQHENMDALVKDAASIPSDGKRVAAR